MPVVEKVVFPLVVNPTVLTVPIAKPLFSTRLTTPVLPAKVVIVLAPNTNVWVTPAPNNSRPVAVSVLVPSWLKICPLPACSVILPVVANAFSSAELFNANEMLPLALVLSAALRETALTEPRVLLFAMVMFAPTLLSVLKSARPDTATVPLVEIAPVDCTDSEVALVAPKSVLAASTTETTAPVSTSVPKVLLAWLKVIFVVPAPELRVRGAAPNNQAVPWVIAVESAIFTTVGVPLILIAPRVLAAFANTIPASERSVKAPEFTAPPVCEIPPPPFKVTGVPGALIMPATSRVPVPIALPKVKLPRVPIGNQAISAAVKFNTEANTPLPPTSTLRVDVEGCNNKLPEPVTALVKSISSPIRVRLLALKLPISLNAKVPVPASRVREIPLPETFTTLLNSSPIPPRLPVTIMTPVL